MPSRTLNGLAAAAVAVGLAELIAAPFGSGADPLNAIGSAVIDLTPGPVKEWAIQTFGTADKLFLSITMLAVIAALAAAAGQWETRRRPIGSGLIAAAGVAGSAAILSRPGGELLDVIPTVAGTVFGILVLRVLTAKTIDVQEGPDEPDAPDAPDAPDRSRRLSLAAFALLIVGVLGGVIGGISSRRLHSVSGERNATVLPPALTPPPPIPADVQPKGVALPSFITSNARLLPDRHRVARAAGQPRRLAAEDSRHGGP